MNKLFRVRHASFASAFSRLYSKDAIPLVLFKVHKIENGGSIAILAMNRPSLRNAFNTSLAIELAKHCETIDSNPEIRAMILTGSGGTFCSGADLKERNGLDTQSWHKQHKIYEKMFENVGFMSIPTIAAVEGFALAGGFELALNCDMIVCSERSVFGLPEAIRGIMPGGGGTQLLTRLVGPARAKEIILTGRRIDAEEASKIGIISLITKEGESLTKATELAERIASNAPLSVKAIKSAIDEGSGMNIKDARRCELKYYESLIDTEDRQEGIRSFNEKRLPVWKGK